MDAELKAKWVAALRGGEYEQGRWHLRENRKFCCMGVLCDVADPSLWNRDGAYADGGHGFPPAELLKYPTASKLASLNDRERWTFAEIADYIEVYL
jgi:hypothetical protein